MINSKNFVCVPLSGFSEPPFTIIRHINIITAAPQKRRAREPGLEAEPFNFSLPNIASVGASLTRKELHLLNNANGQRCVSDEAKRAFSDQNFPIQPFRFYLHLLDVKCHRTARNPVMRHFK